MGDEFDVYWDEAAWAALGQCPDDETIESALGWAEQVQSLERSDLRVAHQVQALTALITAEPDRDDESLRLYLVEHTAALPAEQERIISLARIEAAFG